ncbi:MAG: N-acetylmuramoyl-L-alanine amidase [Defluviitaleaceae bacterium]|nr:N-acetylmuramoyl-L-alanine amidase [Defluviitaleaceae bacterium]
MDMNFLKQQMYTTNTTPVKDVRSLIPIMAGIMLNSKSNYVASNEESLNTLASIWPPYPGVVLRRGMNGPSITQVQERLNELGATPRLATDGAFGPLTEAAVMTFQRANGLMADGVVGPNTWNALFTHQPVAPPSIWPPYPGVILRRGMNGPSITQVQERLNELGANPRLATDGNFGPLTEVAVMAFQRANNLNPDGIVGPNTWNALFSHQPIPPVPPPSARTIVIDPGHGGSDSGAVFGSRREADDTLRLSIAVRNLLQTQGQRVIMTRSADTFVDLGERSAISNRNNADLFVSIHRNSSTNTYANGVDNFVFTTAPNSTVQKAFDVLDEVVDAGVQNNRGVMRANFAVLRNTQAPSMLLEMGFITNTRDNQLFDQNFNAYASAIARGIMTALNTPRPPQSQTFYTVVSGDILWTVAQRFGTTQNAIIQLNKLTNNNINVGQVLKIPR